MIVITLNQALMIYSIILAAGFFFLLLYAELKIQRTAERLEKQHLWRCTICTYTYLDRPGVESSVCPRCASVSTLQDEKAKLVDTGQKMKINREKSKKKDVSETGPRKNPSRGKQGRGGHRGPRRRSR